MKTLQFAPHNLPKPTCPDIYILKEGEDYDYNKPYAIDNGFNEWLYNFPATDLECKYLTKTTGILHRLPTDEEFTELLKTKTDMPNVVFAGFCHGGSCFGRGYSGYYWSSSVYTPSPTSSWSRFLTYTCAAVVRDNDAQTYASSARTVIEIQEWKDIEL